MENKTFQAKLGEDLDEGNGWDWAFGKEAKCCPGDDFAYFGNHLKRREKVMSKHHKVALKILTCWIGAMIVGGGVGVVSDLQIGGILLIASVAGFTGVAAGNLWSLSEVCHTRPIRISEDEYIAIAKEVQQTESSPRKENRV